MGFTLNPAAIAFVKYAILAAWAFVESVLDLRTLLQGGKIPIIKTNHTWTSNLSELPSLLSGWSKAKESSTGFDYQSHMAALLLMQNNGKVCMRAMDMQEATAVSYTHLVGAIISVGKMLHNRNLQFSLFKGSVFIRELLHGNFMSYRKSMVQKENLMHFSVAILLGFMVVRVRMYM